MRLPGFLAPNHKLRRAVTALAIGNVGKRGEAGAGGHAGKAHATGCCDTQAKPRSPDTSRIAWAKLMARAGEEFPLECPNCGGDVRLIAFITEPGPIRKILTHLGEPLEPPSGEPPVRNQQTGNAAHEPLITSSVTVEVPFAGLSLGAPPETRPPTVQKFGSALVE